MQNLEKRIEALEQKSNTAESMLIVRVIVTPFNLGEEWRTAGVPGIDRRWEREESESAEAFKQRVFGDAQAEGIRVLVVNGDLEQAAPLTSA